MTIDKDENWDFSDIFEYTAPQILPNLLSQQRPPTLTDEVDSTLYEELEMTWLEAANF